MSEVEMLAFNIKVHIEILRVKARAYDHPNLHKNMDDYSRGFDPSAFSGKKPTQGDKL